MVGALLCSYQSQLFLGFHCSYSPSTLCLLVQDAMLATEYWRNSIKNMYLTFGAFILVIAEALLAKQPEDLKRLNWPKMKNGSLSIRNLCSKEGSLKTHTHQQVSGTLGLSPL